MRVLAIMGAGAKIGVLFGALDRMSAAETADIDGVVGTSSGSLVGAAFAWKLAGNPEPWQAMGEMLLAGGLQDKVYRKPRLGHVGEAYSFVRKGALWDHAPLLDTITRVIKAPPPRFRCVVTNMNTGEAEAMPGWPLALQASCTIPMVWPLVPMNGHLYADGGLRDNSPVRHAVAWGATEVHAVLSKPLVLDPWVPSGLIRGLDHLIRTQDIMMHSALVDDLNETRVKNGLAGYRQVGLTVTQPAVVSGDTLDFSTTHQLRGIEIGRQAETTRWD